MTTDIIHHLRAATKDIHLQLHQQPLLTPLMAKNTTRDQYLATLCAFYSFYHPLHAQCEVGLQHLDLNQLSSPVLKWLKQDLFHYGIDPTRLPLCTTLPNLVDRDSYAGFLYVKEGSLLGGRLIFKNLSQQLSSDNSFYFFKGREKQTAQHWQRVCDALEARSGQASLITMQNAATSTFECLKLWLDTFYKTHRTHIAARQEPTKSI